MAHNENILRTDESLTIGQYLRSKNGLFTAVLQEDGNLVIYRGDLPSAVLWSAFDLGSKRGGTGWKLVMQGDGNFIIYNGAGQSSWSLPNNIMYGKNRAALLGEDGRLIVGPKEGGDEVKWANAIWWTDQTDTIDESSWEYTRFDYDTDNAKITQIGKQHESMSSSICVDPALKLNQDLTLSVAVGTTKSSTWKSTTTLKIGVKTNFKCGIPSLAEGKVEASTEFSQGFEYGETTSESKTQTVNLPAKAAPGECVVARCTWSVSNITVSFKAVGKVHFNGYSGKIPVHIDGVYEGVTSHDVKGAWALDKQAMLEKGWITGGGRGVASAVGGDDRVWHSVAVKLS